MQVLDSVLGFEKQVLGRGLGLQYSVLVINSTPNFSRKSQLRNNNNNNNNSSSSSSIVIVVVLSARRTRAGPAKHYNT